MVNGSQLHGSIVTGGGTATVVTGSTIDNGGITVAGIRYNTISVTISTVMRQVVRWPQLGLALFPNSRFIQR